jgi:acyl-CoA synthetase (AMP-forming)/AMP-acid ligase II
MDWNSTAATMIAEALRRHGSETAVITEDGDTISFDQLRDRVWRLAGALTDGLGLKKGDRLAILADNCPEYIEVDFACALTGVVKVPLYVRNAPSEHVDMINDAGVSVALVEPAFAAPLAEALGGAGELARGILIFDRPGAGAEVDGLGSYEDLVANAKATRPDHDLILPTDPYQVRFTGGTTGRSKGAVTDHGAMLTACLGNLRLFQFEDAVGPGDVFAHTMGISHVDAFLISAFSWAGAAHLTLRKFDPEKFLALTARDQISMSMMAPAMIDMLFQDPTWVEKYDTSSLKTITYGGAPMPPPVLSKALEGLGPVVAQVYGSTEAPSLTTLLPKRDHLKGDEDLLRSCGFPMPWLRIETLDDEDQITPVGEPGEIGVRGRNILTEYVGNPEATAAAKANGWYHTGDMATKDERGYLYILDRKTDMILSGGYNIYPAEVEKAISRHPDVVEVAVVRSEHERWGETVSAVVTTKPDSELNLAELQAHCEAFIGSYKKPRRARISTDPLPRSEFGKVLRRELQDNFLSGDYEGE